MPNYADGEGPLDDQIWLLVNSGCQLDVSALLSVPDRRKLIKAVVAAHRKSMGDTELSPEQWAASGAVGTARLKG